jgi:hypothetical protein
MTLMDTQKVPARHVHFTLVSFILQRALQFSLHAKVVERRSRFGKLLPDAVGARLSLQLSLPGVNCIPCRPARQST